MKIKTRMVSTHLLITLVALVFMISIGMSNIHDMLSKRAGAGIDGYASIQEARVEQIIEQHHDRLAVFTSRTQLRDSLKSYLGGDQSEGPRIRRILEDSRESIPDFDTVMVLGTDGTVLFSTDQSLEGQDYSKKSYLLDGNAGSTITVVTEPDMGRHLHLSGPLILDGQAIGVAVISEEMASLEKVTGDYTGLGDTGETELVLQDEAGEPVLLTQRRFEDEAIAVPVGRLPIDIALDGEDVSIGRAVDYRGQPVLFSSRYIEEEGWGLVVKQDEAEIYAQYGQLEKSLWFMGIVLLFLVGMMTYVTAKAMAEPIEKLTRLIGRISKGDEDAAIEPELLASEDEVGDLARAFERTMVSLKLAARRVKTGAAIDAAGTGKAASARLEELLAMLESMDLGIVAVNTKGDRTYLNEKAKRIFEPGGIPPWEWAKAYGAYMPDRKTPMPVEKMPLMIALSGKSVHGHPVHIRNENRKTWLALKISAMPVKDIGGNIIGAVSFFQFPEGSRKNPERKAKDGKSGG
ncbi:MAG: HAMP domain-containing protein [Candidatus Micrarchaeota archaeon]